MTNALEQGEYVAHKATGHYISRSLYEAGSPEYRFTTGYVATPDGVVGVYMQDGHTGLVLVHAGREHRGWWKRRFQERFLITLCRRFAAKVVRETRP